MIMNREKYCCPICNEKGEELKQKIQTGYMMGSKEYVFMSNNVVFDDKKIYTCPKCHILFYEEI